MKALIDEDLCKGCTSCIDICPDVFDIDDIVLAVEFDSNLIELVQEACNSCPVGAITLE